VVSSTVNSNNFFLRINGTTTKVPAAISCTNTTCSLRPSSTLTPGQYYQAVVDPVGVPPILGNRGDAVASATTTFRASTFEEETSPAESYAWRTVSSSSAYGGSYTEDHLAGASASFTFTGTSITWYTVTAPQFGKATVYIDGSSKGTVDSYTSSVHYKVAHSYGGLTSATHTIKIVVNGTLGATSGTGTYVAVDAFQVGTTVSSTPAATYQWRPVHNASVYGSSYTVADLAGESTSFTFHGTSITWYTINAPNQGDAKVYVDGVPKGTINDYASSTLYKRAHTFGSLTSANHTIRIVVLGTHQSGATGSQVVIDAWAIG
jgi:hypothetical protein